jgi:predicted nucleic acid-binding protein
MSELCVDASVAIKWFIKGEFLRNKAFKLLNESIAYGITLIAPPLFELEVDSIIQTRIFENRVTQNIADRTYKLLDNAPVAIVTHPLIRQRAREIARQFRQRKVYDALMLRLRNLETVIFGRLIKLSMMR